MEPGGLYGSGSFMNKLQIPNPLKDLAPITYDLSGVEAAESRVHEIAFLTGSRGQEMSAVFHKACFDLAKIYSDLHLQHRYAEKRVGDRRAVIVLDLMPEILAQKKGSNNEQTRQAIIDLDSEYSKALYVEIEIEAAVKLVRGKLSAMEGALKSIQEITSDTMRVYNRYNPGLIAETPELSSTVKEEVLTSSTGVKYGKPRY